MSSVNNNQQPMHPWSPLHPSRAKQPGFSASENIQRDHDRATSFGSASSENESMAYSRPSGRGSKVDQTG
ncbi:MAG: hypothetical protein LW817_02750 [Candidatus Caenarcaniphilales bacterium]|jgi:hypothetical protein|nr:hypothetical protein [Candidatus Caenarcaniphilales bacterium]